MILLWMGHKHISAELQSIKFEVGISFLGEKKKNHTNQTFEITKS